MLRFHEKVYLLLLVQDCLLEMHDLPLFSTLLNQVFNCIGIDNKLIYSDNFRTGGTSRPANVSADQEALLVERLATLAAPGLFAGMLP